MTKTDAIDKICKLRELGKSGNAHEAKSARAHAVALMAKYSVSELELRPRKPEAPIAESIDDLVGMVFDVAEKVAGGKWRPQDDPRAAEILDLLRRVR